MRCGTIGSCQSAATSEDCKELLVTSLTHISGAIASAQTFICSIVAVIVGSISVIASTREVTTYGRIERCILLYYIMAETPDTANIGKTA